IDYSRLSEKYKPIERSYGKSQILEKDYHDPNQIAIIIQEMVEEVAMRLRNHHVDTSVIHLSAGYSRYSTRNGFSHQKKIMATDSSKELVPYFLEMFWKYQENDAVRSVAVRGSVRKMRIYNAKEIPTLKSQISQHQLRNLAFFVAQLKRPLVVSLKYI
ncbi:hypothetical protein ACM6OG_003029, partial [Listeria monocytogenes]